MAKSSNDEDDDPREIVNVILLFLRACFAGEDMFGEVFPVDLREDVPSKVSPLVGFFRPMGTVVAEGGRVWPTPVRRGRQGFETSRRVTSLCNKLFGRL